MMRPIYGTSPIMPSGIVVCQDGFEDPPLKWIVGAAGGTIARDSSMAYSGGRSLRIQTLPVIDNQGRAVRYFSRLSNEKIGLEFWFHSDDSGTDYVVARFDLQDGVTGWYAEMHIDPTSGEIEIYTAEGLVSVGYVDRFRRPDAWIHFKITMDFEKHTYGWVSIANKRVVLTDYVIRNAPDTSRATFGVGIGLATTEAAVKTLYIDDVLITNNEDI